MKEAWLLLDQIIKARNEVPVDAAGRPVPSADDWCAFLDKISAPCSSFSELVEDETMMIYEESETPTPFVKIRNIIHQLSSETEGGAAAEDDILQRAAELDIPQAKARETLDRLRAAGSVFAPRVGTYALVG